MNPRQEAALRRHQLRIRLRRYRTEAGIPQRKVAEQLSWSQSKLLRIESGEVGLSQTDLTALLDLYGVRDQAVVEELRELARQSRRQPWGEYRDVLHPAYLVYLRYELAAARIRNFQPFGVPAPLQTEAYAWYLITAFAPPDTPKRTLQRLLEARLVRREILDGKGEPEMSFVIDEAVLRRLVGIGPPGGQVMREQLQWLAELSQRPAITIQVLPFTHPLQPGMNESFLLLDLAATGERLLYLEGVRGASAVRTEQELVERYERTFERLSGAATEPQQLVAVLDKLMP